MNVFALIRRRHMKFTPSYRELVKLKDGRTVLVRMIRPEDRQYIDASFSSLSPKTRYLRFHNGKESLTDAELKHYSEIDGINHFALGALWEKKGVGVIRFYRDRDNPELAEVAIVIIDEFQTKGLGEILLRRTISAARERGIHRLQFKLLPDNEGMRRLIGKVSPLFEQEFEDEELVIYVNIE